MPQLYDLHAIPFSLDGAGMLTFATVADLEAYDDSASLDGAFAYVQSVRSVWQRRVQADPLTADGITNVENPTNTATWYRSTEASPSWLDQADWYIDGNAGDDEGSGSVLEPLATHAEFMRRLGQNRLTQNLTAHFVDTAVYLISHTTLPGQHNGFQVFYKGPDLVDRTPIYTDTFAGFQAISRIAPGARTEFTSALAKATWDTYVGKIVLVTDAADPAVIGAYAWVCATSQADDTVIYTTPFTQAAIGNADATPVDPADGDTYVVVDPLDLQIAGFQVWTSEPARSDREAVVQFQSLGLGFDRGAIASSGSVAFFSSWLSGLNVKGPAFAEAWGCQLLDVFHTSSGATMDAAACFLDGTTDSMTMRADDAGATLSVTDDSVVMGNATIFAKTGGQVYLSNLGAFNIDGYVVILTVGAQAELADYIYGDNIADSYFRLGVGTRVISDATLIATTTAPNVFFGGAITQDWAGLPFIANALVADSQAAWLNSL